MLRAEDNKFLTESGAGTGMGELLRRFWLPVLQSEELAEADGPPKRNAASAASITAGNSTPTAAASTCRPPIPISTPRT